jgi:hypothetical protein
MQLNRYIPSLLFELLYYLTTTFDTELLILTR